MAERYIISIDQSTQGTKALLFDESGSLIRRTDKPHEQIINEKGWVSHDPSEIYENVIEVVKMLTEDIDKSKVAGIGISNQRETSLAWDRVSGKPIGHAIVWQCARAVSICPCDRVAVCKGSLYLRESGEKRRGGEHPPKDGNESVALFSGL